MIVDGRGMACGHPRHGGPCTQRFEAPVDRQHCGARVVVTEARTYAKAAAPGGNYELPNVHATVILAP
jgi:hypothetical protein